MGVVFEHNARPAILGGGIPRSRSGVTFWRRMGRIMDLKIPAITITMRDLIVFALGALAGFVLGGIF